MTKFSKLKPDALRCSLSNPRLKYCKKGPPKLHRKRQDTPNPNLCLHLQQYDELFGKNKKDHGDASKITQVAPGLILTPLPLTIPPQATDTQNQ